MLCAGRKFWLSSTCKAFSRLTHRSIFRSVRYQTWVFQVQRKTFSQVWSEALLSTCLIIWTLFVRRRRNFIIGLNCRISSFSLGCLVLKALQRLKYTSQMLTLLSFHLGERREKKIKYLTVASAIQRNNKYQI